METPLKPTISMIHIDMKKKRLRIHHQTFHLLADSDYVQLLVTPQTVIIGIRRIFCEDHLTRRVNTYQIGDY